jgi:hypothetical protein
MPEKEKRKYLALNHKTTVAECQEAAAELMKWQDDVSKLDAALKDKSKQLLDDEIVEDTRGSKRSKIPIRGTKITQDGI